MALSGAEERPSTERLLVQVILRSADEVLEILAAAPVDPEARTRAESVLALAFGPVWGRIPLLALSVTDAGMEWEGGAVVGDREGGRLLPALRTAGIRSLTFVPGVENGEIQVFLAAVDRARGHAALPGADLVTLLFRADLQHLGYALDEATLSARGQPGPSSGPAATIPGGAPALREAVRRDAAAEVPRGVVRLERFDSTLYFLDKQEIEYLKSSFEEEYARSPSRGVITLLFETLEAREEADVRAEVLEALTGLLPSLLGAGSLGEVAHLVSEARRVSQSGDLTQEQKGALEHLRASVSEPKALGQLFHALEDGRVRVDSEAIWTLMRELRPEAVRHLLLWPEQMANREASALVSRAVDAFFQEWPLALGRMLAAPDRTSVHAALEVAARVKHRDFADLVDGAAQNPDPTTRARVAVALTAIGTPRSLKRLSQMASDADGEVRASVFSAFAARPSRSVVTTLEAAIGSADLEQRSEREKRAIFEAYGASAGQDGVETLAGILRGRGRTKVKPSSHTRACAALGLGRIGTPQARAALAGAALDRDPLVRNAVGSALRGIA